MATALALHRLGHTDLADRFAAWVFRGSPGALKDQLEGLLEIAGLPTAPVDGHDDLDTLIDELLVVDDELDRREP